MKEERDQAVRLRIDQYLRLIDERKHQLELMKGMAEDLRKGVLPSARVCNIYFDLMLEAPREPDELFPMSIETSKLQRELSLLEMELAGLIKEMPTVIKKKENEFTKRWREARMAKHPNASKIGGIRRPKKTAKDRVIR